MGATDPAQGAGASNPAQAEAKGKGKAAPEDVSMGEEDTSSDEETGAEDDVCCVNPFPHPVFCPIIESQVFHNHYMNEWLLITLFTTPRLQKCVCYNPSQVPSPWLYHNSMYLRLVSATRREQSGSPKLVQPHADSLR